MSEVLVESEFSLRSRHREIGDLLAQNQIERAQKRLLDFVRDFGTRADERVAILLGGELRGLMDEQRKYGASKGPEILKVCERMLSLADKVADAFESSEPAATEITRHLEAIGGAVSYGHAADNVRDADVVVTSSAIRHSGPAKPRARELQ